MQVEQLKEIWKYEWKVRDEIIVQMKTDHLKYSYIRRKQNYELVKKYDFTDTWRLCAYWLTSYWKWHRKKKRMIFITCVTVRLRYLKMNSGMAEWHTDFTGVVTQDYWNRLDWWKNK